MPDLTASRAGRLLGCRLPIVLAGMGGVARSELAAAVAAAGGFGFLGMVREPPELIAREVERVRALGATHFGVNIIPASTPPDLLERQVQTIIDLGVPVVGLFWDIDAALVRRFIDAGIVVVILGIAILGLAIDAVGQLDLGTRSQAPAVDGVAIADVGGAELVVAVELGIGVAGLGINQAALADHEA